MFSGRVTCPSPEAKLVKMSRLVRDVQLFMVPEDEEAFFGHLRSRFPALVVIDGRIWKDPEPPVRKRMADCQQHNVYLWNRTLYPTIPFSPRPAEVGGFRGPNSGVVIQWLRCREAYSVLKAGSLSVGASEDAMIAFVKDVWSMMRRLTRNDLVNLLGNSASEFRLGEATRRWFLEDPTHRLRASNTEQYFVIAGSNRDPRNAESGWVPVASS
jgi:hypothetical protein